VNINTNSEVLFETTTYKVEIQEAIMREPGIPVYAVINKNTGIVENETSALPIAIRTAQDFEAMLEEIENPQSADFHMNPGIIAPPPKVVN
jgi:hypothetical protein